MADVFTRSKCTNDKCENYGNPANNGQCNRCFHKWAPPGPNYKDKPEFPKPLSKTDWMIEYGTDAEKEIAKQLKSQPPPKPKESTSPAAVALRNRQGVSLDEDLTEYLDPPHILDQKVNVLVNLIKQAKCVVVYTGAGISTSANISDYRGPDGAWIRQLKGLPPKRGPSLDSVTPTSAHMALYELVKCKKVDLIVSTNLDNLHRRSGVGSQYLSELHGNSYKEVCEKCNKEFFRSHPVRSSPTHFVGKYCPKCKGRLQDSIINFGENLPEKEMKQASEMSKKADVAFVLGSSMRVKPACWLPEYSYSFGNSGKIIICNLQMTDYENKSYLTLFAPTDTVMSMVMQKLGMEIPKYNPTNDPTELQRAQEEENQQHDGDNDNDDDEEDNDENSVEEAPDESRAGHVVDIKKDCPHAQNCKSDVMKKAGEAFNKGCGSCQAKNENWYCLSCGNVGCGRYVNGHARAHFESSKSCCISLSFADLSCWCYSCNDYIESSVTNMAVSEVHKVKFGTQLPSNKPKD